MRSLFLVYLFTLTIYVTCVPPTKVIEITTWNPIDTTGVSINNISNDFVKLLEESFQSGKTLVDSDKLGFYEKITEEDVKFFSPNKFASYALSYAHFEGLLNRNTKKPFSVVENAVSQIKLKKIDSESGLSSVDTLDRNLDNTFLVVDSSILLESPSFDCQNKKTQIAKNKQRIPLSVTSTCASVLEERKDSIDGQVPIQTLLDMYRNSATNPNANILGLENCIEQYVFSVYYSNSVLIKLNAGELLSEIVSIIDTKEDKSAKFYSYNVPSDMFLAVLTAIQKVVHAAKKKDPSLASQFYWSSLKKFNRKIYIEVYKNENSNNTPELKVFIQGHSGQNFLNSRIPSNVFRREVSPFLIEDFNDFKVTCEIPSTSGMDLKSIFFPSDMLDIANNIRGPIFFLLVIVGVILIVLVSNYKFFKRVETSEIKELEFKKINSFEEDESSAQKKGYVVQNDENSGYAE